jgi:hypothetical protein
MALIGGPKRSNLRLANFGPSQQIGGGPVSAMRQKPLVISVIGCVCLVLAVIVCGALPRAHIAVKKALTVPLREIPAASVDVRNITHEADGAWEMYLLNAIEAALNKAGTSRTFDKKRAVVLVECRCRHGWCLPYFGRHLDIHWSSINWVDLVVIDRKSGTVLGEVEFHRPLLTKRPTDDLIDLMCAAMAGKLGEARTPSATEKPPR